MMQHDVIIACDFKSAEDTFKFLDLFRDEERKPFLKIGMELFYAEGPAIVREIKRRGHRIFLDLKLHDIPNTVKKAMAVLSRLDVDMCNVHAAGTLEAGMVHEACGKEFLTVTPGVRFADGDVADQVRVTTPARAREIGSDFIVVGRPITAAADPVAAYRRCVSEFCD